jgi:hypothetical protein
MSSSDPYEPENLTTREETEWRAYLAEHAERIRAQDPVTVQGRWDAGPECTYQWFRAYWSKTLLRFRVRGYDVHLSLSKEGKPIKGATNAAYSVTDDCVDGVFCRVTSGPGRSWWQRLLWDLRRVA